VANRRRTSAPPALETKDFTPEEIDAGSERLRKRIEEVQALREGVRYDDQRRHNAENNIRRAVLEIFGERSLEYQQSGHPRIWKGSLNFNMHPAECQRRFLDGIPDTVSMLENLIAVLEEKRPTGQSLAGRARAAFNATELHPRIAGACAELYEDGHYSNAVLNASLALVNFVKEKSGRFDLDGTDLMMQVFSPKNPTLVFSSLGDQSDLDEQQGLMFLSVGSVLAFRNPRAHKLLDDDPEAALEYIGFLSLLAKRLAKGQRRKPA